MAVELVVDNSKAGAQSSLGMEMPFAKIRGELMTQLPADLFIPPDALSVVLEQFEGPLDLLLYLIRRHSLDILDIPMADLTRQYMTYVEAMRDGAYDFLEKPFSPETLLGSLRRALEKRRLVLENRALHEQADNRAKLDSTLLGVSRGLQTLRRQVLDLATLPHKT